MEHALRGREAQTFNRTLLTQAFIVSEEKQAVLEDRSARGSSKLVPSEGRGGQCVKEPASVQLVVAQEFEHLAVKAIAPSLGNHIDNPGIGT